MEAQPCQGAELEEQLKSLKKKQVLEAQRLAAGPSDIEVCWGRWATNEVRNYSRHMDGQVKGESTPYTTFNEFLPGRISTRCSLNENRAIWTIKACTMETDRTKMLVIIVVHLPWLTDHFVRRNLTISTIVYVSANTGWLWDGTNRYHNRADRRQFSSEVKCARPWDKWTSLGVKSMHAYWTY